MVPGVAPACRRAARFGVSPTTPRSANHDQAAWHNDRTGNGDDPGPACRPSWLCLRRQFHAMGRPPRDRDGEGVVER